MDRVKLTFVMMAGLGCSLAAFADPFLRNRIVAIVNETIITSQEVENFTLQAVDLLRRTFRAQPEVYEKRYTETIKDGIDQLIQRQLILAEFKTLNASLSDTFIEDQIRERIRKQYNGDRATLTQTLQKQGTTYAEFRQRTREEIVIGYMLDKNISSTVIISPAKIERFYTNHLDRFSLGEQVQLRMISLNRPAPIPPEDIAKLAIEIHAKIQQGAPFAEMAAVYSEGSTRKEGGNWGWVEKSKLNAGLAEVAFRLEPGKISAVLARASETNEDYWIYQYNVDGHIVVGRKYTSRDQFIEERFFADNPTAAKSLPPPLEFYIVMVEAKRPGRTRPLDEVREEIEQELRGEERTGREKKWIDRLASKSFVFRY